MTKKFTSLLIVAIMMVAVSVQAQVSKSAFKKQAATAKTATVKPGKVKGVHKKWTTEELQTAKQAADKQKAVKQKSGNKPQQTVKDKRQEPANHRSLAPRRVDIADATPVSVPYEADFSQSDEAMETDFIIINNNDDTSDGEPCTWKWSSGNGAYYIYNVDGETAADDYLVLPVTLEAGKKYEVTLHVYGNSYNTERFEVVAGTSATAEGLNISVIAPTEVEGETPAVYSSSFTAETSGLYYVAVHALSDANAYFMYVKSISVEQGAEPNAPAAPTLTATAGAEGALTAAIQVTAPDKTVDGSALTTISKVELYRDEELIDQNESVTPGAELSFTDASITASGIHQYVAIAYNENGKGEKSEAATVYIGIDEPVAPETVKATDHATSVDMSWSKVSNVGMNGGYVDPDKVTYKIWDMDVSEYFVFFNDVVASVTGETSTTFDYDVDEGDTQTYKYFAVRPVNESTVDEDKSDWRAAGILTGTPYDAVTEGFANEELHYFWETDASLAITSYSADGDGTALAMLSTETGQKAFISGKLNLKDAERPMLVFSALNANNIPTLYVLSSKDMGEWKLLQTVSLSSNDYERYQIDLSSLKDHERYAQIAFVASYTNATVGEDYGDYFFLDDIRIGQIFNHNLSVTAAASSSTLTAGKKATITVYVENTGLQKASNYTVSVKAGEKELLNETVTEPLASFGKKEFEAEWATTVFDEAGDVNVTISVDYDADEVKDDNTIEGIFTITEPAVTVPINMQGNEGTNGVDLEWNAPNVTKEDVTENFENGEGDFTQIDGNGDGYGWNFIYSDELKTNSGYGGMQSYSWVPNVGAVYCDDWLVTPRAILDGTFRFWAAAQDGDWTDEHFAVYVSTAGNTSVSDFTLVSEEFVTTSWPQEYTVDLSSYGGEEGYIAIRHYNSYDNFAMVIDDISFIKAPELPVAYNVYIGENFVTTVTDLTITLNSYEGVQEGNNTFAVTAVYANGSESKPVTVDVNVTSGIDQIVSGDKAVDVYSVDGKLVRSQTKTLDGLKGIYVVGGKTVIVK